MANIEVEKKTGNADALKAIRYDAKIKVGGNKLSNKPSSYGLALKWLIHTRGLTYKEFAKRYNNTTAQNLNHLINRVDKTHFFDENVEDMCRVLNVRVEYFKNLCEDIDKLLEV